MIAIRLLLIGLSCIGIMVGLKAELAKILKMLGRDIDKVKTIRDMVSNVQNGDEQLLIMSQLVALTWRIKLQKLALPLCLFAGTTRYLPYFDFPAQVNTGIIIEVITITVPFLTIAALYSSYQEDGVDFVILIGIMTHIAELLLSLKHIHNNSLEQNRPCILLDQRTCFKLRNSFQCCCCKSHKAAKPISVAASSTLNNEIFRANKAH